MTTHIISDLHLSKDRPDITDRFTGFCRSLSSETDAVYILGDLFEYWIGDDGVDALGLTPVVHELSRISDSGIALHVMRGNRDFLLGDVFAEATGAQMLEDPSIVNFYGRRVLLAHGDAYCTDDLQHQRWRSLCLDAAWQKEQLSKPIATRVAMANHMREQSRLSTKEKTQEIMDVTVEAIQGAFAEHHIDVLIHGHTHRPGLHSYQLPGRPDGSSDVTSDSANTPSNNNPSSASASLAQIGYRLVLGDWYDQTSQIKVTPNAVILQPGDCVLPNWTQDSH